MNQSRSERRLVENEMLLRDLNHKVLEDLEALSDIARSHGQSESIPKSDDHTIQFYCECSDLTCTARIELLPSEYKQLHQNVAQFICAPGHNIPEIERVMKQEATYIVVEKFIAPVTS